MCVCVFLAQVSCFQSYTWLLVMFKAGSTFLNSLQHGKCFFFSAKLWLALPDAFEPHYNISQEQTIYWNHNWWVFPPVPLCPFYCTAGEQCVGRGELPRPCYSQDKEGSSEREKHMPALYSDWSPILQILRHKRGCHCPGMKDGICPGWKHQIMSWWFDNCLSWYVLFFHYGFTTNLNNLFSADLQPCKGHWLHLPGHRLHGHPKHQLHG